jgi:hypothetical protein
LGVGFGDFYAKLLKDFDAFFVGYDSVTVLPDELVVGVDSFGGKKTFDF